MARRSDHSKDELTALAIDKAVEIIDENGLRDFSARQVAARMGYTVGTLYHFFGDLDSFMLHVNGRILDEWHEDLTRALGRQKGDRLRYLAQSYLAFARKNPHRWSALFELRNSEKPIPEWYRDKIGRLFSLIESELAPRLKKTAKVADTAKVLWASVHGICVLSLSAKLDIVDTKKAESLIDLLLETTLK